MSEDSHYYLKNIFYQDNAAILIASKTVFGRFKTVARISRDLSRIATMSVKRIKNEKIFIIDGLNQRLLFERKIEQFPKNCATCFIAEISDRFDYHKKFQINFFNKNFCIILFMILKYVTFNKTKDLLILYYHLQKQISRDFEENFPSVNKLFFFNDRSYLNYLIISSAKKLNVQTIVYQHGYIANLSSYFPIHADEFLSWGRHAYDLAETYGQAHKVTVDCRSLRDRELLNESLQIPHKNNCQVLIAFNYRADQLGRLSKVIGTLGEWGLPVTVKLHPSQKLKSITKIKLKWLHPKVRFVALQMDELVEMFDVLITISSTSAFDFLLRGKPVVFLDDGPIKMIPSFGYGFGLGDLKSNFSMDQDKLCAKNSKRISFLSYHLGNIDI